MDDAATFDKKQLLTNSGDDEELAGQVAGIFLFDTPKQFVALQEALDANDAQTVERVAHSIKGASATVGGTALREAAFVGERLGREGKLNEIPPVLEQMRQKYRELEQALIACGYQSMDPDS